MNLTPTERSIWAAVFAQEWKAVFNSPQSPDITDGWEKFVIHQSIQRAGRAIELLREHTVSYLRKQTEENFALDVFCALMMEDDPDIKAEVKACTEALKDLQPEEPTP